MEKKVLGILDTIKKSLISKEENTSRKYRLEAINEYEELLKGVDITEYLLVDSNPVFSKSKLLESYFNMGTLYKMEGEYGLSKRDNLDECIKVLRKGINCFKMMLRVQLDETRAIEQIVSTITIIIYNKQPNWEECIMYLQEGLVYASASDILHYNLGFCYQKMLKLEASLIHYRISLRISEDNKNKLNCLNGIAGIYKSLKQWPEALHYLKIAEKIKSDDPDICNQLGIVYTEMRRTDISMEYYKKALQNTDKSFITNNSKVLESEIYLNMGFMYSYDGDNFESIECYNKSLGINPRFPLPFQNKIMNLNYIFDELESSYITNQHKLINKLYKRTRHYKERPKRQGKRTIGFISGDFIEHPVSFFISTFLRNYDKERFEVICYSECVINTRLMNDDIKFKFIKNKTAVEVSDMIYEDGVDILFDLAGHTAFNRIDVFAQKPARVQISYIGYPFTTGLETMDYRVTDRICDKEEISSKYYTEKLLYMKNCFLCYDAELVNGREWKTPELRNQPFLENGYLTIGCFNRLNKMTKKVTELFNEILCENLTVRFVFKTKALLNKSVIKKFLDRFNEKVRDRIDILNCTLHHRDHLLEYNKMDISIDTFPYSGTTTSCESLYMGVPVYSIYDKETYYHGQNVTCSILTNSNLDEYICENRNELKKKIREITEKKSKWWKNLKRDTRYKFLNGKVCNKTEYMENFQEMLIKL